MKKLIYCAVITIFIVGCRKNDPQNVATNAKNNAMSETAIRERGLNIPKFENEDALQNTLILLQDKEDTFLDSWEKQKGFTSMRKIFNEINEAEIQMDAKYEGLSPEELAKLEGQPIEHSKEAMMHQDMLVICDTDDGGQYYDKNIHTNTLAKVVNEDGMMIVGDKIYQHTRDKIKVMTKGNLDKISLLKTTVVSNPSESIEVISLTTTTFKTSSGTLSFNRTSQGNNGRLRVIVYEDFIQNISSSNSTYKETTYKITVRSLQRRLLGSWYDNYDSNISLNGSTIGNSTLGNTGYSTNIRTYWSESYSNSSNGQTHTLETFLPYYQIPQYSPMVTSYGPHPEIYQSSHSGTISRNGKTASTTTYYP